MGGLCEPELCTILNLGRDKKCLDHLFIRWPWTNLFLCLKSKPQFKPAVPAVINPCNHFWNSEQWMMPQNGFHGTWWDQSQNVWGCRPNDPPMVWTTVIWMFGCSREVKQSQDCLYFHWVGDALRKEKLGIAESISNTLETSRLDTQSLLQLQIHVTK